MESPSTAVTSFGFCTPDRVADENALCVDEVLFCVNDPRRRKIAEGFSFDNLEMDVFDPALVALSRTGFLTHIPKS